MAMSERNGRIGIERDHELSDERRRQVAAGRAVPLATRRNHSRKPSGMVSSDIDLEYSAEQLDWLQAMEQYKRLRSRPFPTCIEVMEVFLSLGYRKVAPAVTLPDFRA